MSVQFRKPLCQYQRLTALIIIAATPLLNGCFEQKETQSIEAFKADVQRSTRNRIEPLPDFSPYEVFVYTAQDKKDPFQPWRPKLETITKKKKRNSGLEPDGTRRKGPLEQFPIDTLRMVGTLEQRTDRSAILKAPDGLVYRVKTGDFIGQNHGKISGISEESVNLTEIIPDGDGGWMKRETSIALVSQE